jgi:uncharacterized tellurite resistance protein B-like protein
MADQELIKISPAGASIYGFTHAPAESLLNYGYALLTIAGADREVSDIEMDWIQTYYAELLQLPGSFGRAFDNFDFASAELAHIIPKIKFDTSADYRRMLLYDAIKMCGADTSYASDEEMAIREAALYLDVNIFGVESLESLVASEAAISNLRHTLFEIDYDSEPEMLPAHDERLKHNPWVTQQLGYSFATFETMQSTCEILMAVAGADKDITDEEWAWLDELTVIAGIPGEIRDGLRDFDYKHANVIDLLSSLEVDISLSLDRVLVYLSIQMARADRQYALEEQEAAHQAAKILNVDEDIAFDLEKLVELENSLADMRRAMFRHR